MPSFKLVVFDDSIAADWHPFSLTRPVGELLFGTFTMRERLERVFDAPCALQLAPDHLVGFREEGAPEVRPYAGARVEGPTLFLLTRWVPAWDRPADWLEELREAGPIRAGDQVVGWYAPEGSSPPAPDFFRDPTGHSLDTPPAAADVGGRTLERVWELMSRNPEQIHADIGGLGLAATAEGSLPAGVFHWGEHPLILDPDAVVEPGVALDTSAGPIWIEAGARVRAFTRLAGPAYVGRDSLLLGGSIEAVSLGPVCRVRGELAESVCLGYTNKQHDGHMGHAYLGRWVNLGAETTNSDLKNNYGTIRMWTPAGPVDTGEIKMGSLIGDHVKTGIGLLLNTGTVIGAGSNLYGAAMPPTHVPPFSWGTGEELVEYRLDKFLQVAERAMGRRKVPLEASHREQLSRAWEIGRAIAGTGEAGGR